jgi:signal peptidase I
MRAAEVRLGVRPITSMLGRVVLGALAGLLLWAQLPALVLGWTATVVQSGSMRPTLLPGDVVLYQPSPGRLPSTGQIVLARDPGRPDGLFTHRVYQVRADDVITKGDANPSPDSTPLPRSAIRGVARVRVPWVGLPVQWWRAGRHLAAAMLTLAVVVALVLAVHPGADRATTGSAGERARGGVAE